MTDEEKIIDADCDAFCNAILAITMALVHCKTENPPEPYASYITTHKKRARDALSRLMCPFTPDQRPKVASDDEQT
jgi:hypothetical protein